jgi:Tfp pilus assembly protein PilN
VRENEFLPDWYPQARRRRRLVHLQGWLTLLLVMGMGSYLTLADRNIRVAEGSVNALQAQLTETSAKLTEMDKLDVMGRQLRQKEQVINRLGAYVEVCKLIDSLDALMPKQMALTGMQIDNEERVDNSAVQAAKLNGGGGDPPLDRRLKLRIQGVCPTDVDLANFMTQLAAVPFFDQVNITYAREKSEANHVMREFEVSFSLNLNGMGN